MIRRLNYTGRRRIPRDRIVVRLEPVEPDGNAFDASFDLDGLGFPEGASVFVEAYSLASYMRFAFGTVGQHRAPRDTRLVDVLTRPLPKFRLKVVDASERLGLLLGVADQIIPLRADETPDRRQSLLPVDFCDLGERTWRLDLSDWPVLELNKRIDGIAEAARSSDAFLGLLYPEVLRQILSHILVELDITDPGFDDSEWTSLWLRFATALPGVESPPEESGEDGIEARREWVETAVEAFCASRRARRQLEAAIAREIG